MTDCIVFTWSPLLFVFRASGTVYTAIDIATGQEVGFLYPPPYFSFLHLSLSHLGLQPTERRGHKGNTTSAKKGLVHTGGICRAWQLPCWSAAPPHRRRFCCGLLEPALHLPLMVINNDGMIFHYSRSERKKETESADDSTDIDTETARKGWNDVYDYPQITFRYFFLPRTMPVMQNKIGETQNLMRTVRLL